MKITETERLIISKFTLNDAPFYLKLVNTPHWIKYIGDRNIKTLEQAQESLKQGAIKSYSQYGFGFYKLQLKHKPDITIGTCGFVKRKELDNVDFGFALLPEYESKGFGYEASEALLEFFKASFNLNKVVAITLPINSSSIHLLEKLGFTYEKTVIPFDDGEELLLFAKTFH